MAENSIRQNQTRITVKNLWLDWRERDRERKKEILMSFKRPKWRIRPNKRLHLKCGLVFENKSN